MYRPCLDPDLDKSIVRHSWEPKWVHLKMDWILDDTKNCYFVMGHNGIVVI